MGRLRALSSAQGGARGRGPGAGALVAHRPSRQRPRRGRFQARGSGLVAPVGTGGFGRSRRGDRRRSPPLEPRMRRLLSFDCEGAELAASLDEGGEATGMLLVTGGSQTRIGSHRMYERLSKALSERGFSCFRFDRRGVGDSNGEDAGFRSSGPDVVAAAKAFRNACPKLERLFGFGLCDGASALAMFGLSAGLDGLILVNPWLVETQADEPAPAAIRAHYRKRLLSLEGWKKILSGTVDYNKLFRGVLRMSKDQGSSLAEEAAGALRASGVRAWLILAEEDATAIAAMEELKAAAYDGLIEGREIVRTNSHTFARPGDEAALLAATVRALKALGG